MLYVVVKQVEDDWVYESVFQSLDRATNVVVKLSQSEQVPNAKIVPVSCNEDLEKLDWVKNKPSQICFETTRKQI